MKGREWIIKAASSFELEQLIRLILPPWKLWDFAVTVVDRVDSIGDRGRLRIPYRRACVLVLVRDTIPVL